jgi:mono/diheme cytochrome c family protein
MKNLLLLVAGVTVLMACKTGLEVVEEVESVEETTEMPTTAIGEGKVVLLTKCAKCHEAPDVDSYSKEKWDKVLNPMIQKANLTEEEANEVTAYVYWELEN